MKNNTRSEVVIEMQHIDHAVKIKNALDAIKKVWDQGGDAELVIRSNGKKIISSALIGHDVDIKNVRHKIYS